MKYKVLLVTSAKNDIHEAVNYYNKMLDGLGTRFKNDLSSTIKKISSNPFVFGFRFQNVRTANLKIFPFQVHYLIEEEENIIIVLAVINSFRDPNYITARINS